MRIIYKEGEVTLLYIPYEAMPLTHEQQSAITTILFDHGISISEWTAMEYNETLEGYILSDLTDEKEEPDMDSYFQVEEIDTTITTKLCGVIDDAMFCTGNAGFYILPALTHEL